MRTVACLLAAALLGCSASQNATPGGPPPPGSDGGMTTDGPPSGGTPLPCDVDAVFAAHCRQCHQNPPLFASPMPLVTYEDLHAPSKSDPSVPVFQRVGARIHDDMKPMPPPPNARLDATSTGVLDAWVAAGAPARKGTCGTPMPDGGMTDSGGNDASSGCVPDEFIAPASPYTMTTPEEYVCYGFDVPPEAKHHVTEIRVHLDNSQIIHHALLLISPTSVSSTPTPCNPGPSLGDQMLYAWAPGGNPLVVPPAAGFPEDQTIHYMVQIHYNNAVGLPNPMDSSGFDLCRTTTLRPNDADVVAFGSEAIVIFPHATGDVIACYTAPSSFNGTTFFASFPHMHKLGKSITTSLNAMDGGAPIDMGTDSTWDFSTQPWLTVGGTIHTGDVIRTHCSWNNTTDQTVTFGQSTTNEMCFSFTAYYPKIEPPIGWSTPSTGSFVCP